jgi:hypothetical protein
MIYLVILVFISIFFSKRESFSKDNKDDMDFVRAIQRFVTSMTEFDDYIEFLQKHGNKYSKLEELKTFIILKNLKKIGELSVENISRFMTE